MLLQQHFEIKLATITAVIFPGYIFILRTLYIVVFCEYFRRTSFIIYFKLIRFYSFIILKLFITIIMTMFY